MDLPEVPAIQPPPSSPVAIALYVLSAIGLILFIVLSVMGIITWVRTNKNNGNGASPANADESKQAQQKPKTILNMF